MLPRCGRRYAMFLALPSLVACDPASFVRVRQTLRPTPAPTCLEAALRASPLVREVTPERASRGEAEDIVVVLRDSLALDSAWTARVTRAMSRDSMALVTVDYTWVLYRGPRNAAERARLQGLLTTLLDEVRHACAPDSPSPVECQTGWRTLFLPEQARACRAAG